MGNETSKLVECPVALWRTEELPHPERRVARGELARVVRGVFAESDAWHALPPWERYLVRVHAVARIDPDAVFSHESAAVLLGLGVIGDPGAVHVLAPLGGTSRLSGQIRTHTSSVERDLTEAGGLLVTSAGDTAITMARHRHPALGLAVADAALRLDPSLSREMLIADNESQLSARGRRHARWPLERATRLSESTLESINMALIEWLGFPPPEQQREFRSSDGSVDRGDAWWESVRLVAEFDGELKYDGRYGDPIDALRRRSDRDQRLLAEHARAIVRWGWRESARIAPVRALLNGHGLFAERPESTAHLHTLRRLLASHTHPSRETATARRDRG